MSQAAKIDTSLMLQKAVFNGPRGSISADQRAHREDRDPCRVFRPSVLRTKAEQWQPVAPLKALDRYIEVPHVTITLNQSCISAVSKGRLAITLDLKDTHCHVPIDIRRRRVFCFCFFVLFLFSSSAEARCTDAQLSNWACQSPLCFAKVTTHVVRRLRLTGFRIVFCLDDALLSSNSRPSTLHKKQSTALLEHFGFSLNDRK